MLTSTLLYAGLVPLLAAAIVAVVARLFRLSPSTTWACASAAGFLAGLIALKQAGLAAAVRSFAEPHEAVDWLPIIILLTLGVSILFSATTDNNRGVAFALAALLVLAVPLRLLSGNARLDGEWSTAVKIACLVLLAGTFSLIWGLLAAGGKSQQSPARLFFVLIVAVGTAAVLTLSGVFVYGQACGALAAAVTGTAIASWSVGRSSASAESRFAFPGLTGAAGVITFSLGGLIVLGHFFAYLSTTNTLLLFASLAAAGTPLLDTLLRQPAWQQVALRTVACLTPLAIALRLAFV